MRWLVSLFFVLTLGLVGCSETAGTGGTAGDGGSGGDGGGGAGGGECQNHEDCDDQNECTLNLCVFPDAGPTWCDTLLGLEFPCDLDGLVGICVPGGECIEDGLCGDLDCDDGNECTYDYCGEAGACSYGNLDGDECCPWPQGGCFFYWDYGRCADGRCVDSARTTHLEEGRGAL